MAIVNKSAVKDLAGEFRVSGQFYDKLDAVVAEAMKKAQARAESNGRTTLMPYDL